MTLRFSAYLHHHSQLNEFINAGINHIIIDHEYLSVRSRPKRRSEDYTITSVVELIKSVFETSHANNIKISLNCDKLYHPSDFNYLGTLFLEISDFPFFTIRTPDLGLIQFIKDNYPQLKCCYISETGNLNTASASQIAQHVPYQQISNECPIDTIKTYCLDHQINASIQVHGQLLIQYSKRRFLHSIPSFNKNTIIETRMQDDQYPGRYYPLLDNIHGHLMFCYFERSLLRYTSELLHSGINEWIIDTRHLNNDLALKSVQTYITAAKLSPKWPYRQINTPHE